jgi:hypothetical protein
VRGKSSRCYRMARRSPARGPTKPLYAGDCEQSSGENTRKDVGTRRRAVFPARRSSAALARSISTHRAFSTAARSAAGTSIVARGPELLARLSCAR